MHYKSTRNAQQTQRNSQFCDIVLNGLADDGGLMLPETYPQVGLDLLTKWQNLSYVDVAANIMQFYIDDIASAELKKLLTTAYTAEKFGSTDIIEVKTLDKNRCILGLSNGPTLAFKDMAMQFLGELFEYILEQRNLNLNIVGATSGDTGSSAEYAMKGKQRINIFMLSPHQRMSPFQCAQMFSLQDKNIFNIAVKGVFDDCQDLVKALNTNLVFKEKYKLGAVNSINWARILAQVVYYFKGYLDIVKIHHLKIGDPIDFVVPSGNFGNIFAAYVARKMGLPIRKLILATNENNVLDEFFKTGIYRVRKSQEVFETSSPSMDIAKASNFERFIFDLVGAQRTQQLWQKLEQQGFFDFTKEPEWQHRKQWQIESGASSHQDRLASIKQIYNDFNLIIDPHTADGIKVGKAFQEDNIMQVILETALPIKFSATIKEALGFIPDCPDKFKDLEKLTQRCTVMDNKAEDLQAYIIQQLANS